LFNRATKIYQDNKNQSDSFSLGNIIVIPSVKEARERGKMNSIPPFQCFTERGMIWPDGTHKKADTVIWCTGFKRHFIILIT